MKGMKEAFKWVYTTPMNSEEIEVFDLGVLYGGLAGLGYSYWTGALTALIKAYQERWFLFSSLPVSRVAIPVVTGLAVGGPVALAGYKIYETYKLCGMISNHQNVQSIQNQGQNQRTASQQRNRYLVVVSG